MFLLIYEIKLSPRPTATEISKRLDKFIDSYQAVCDQLHLAVPALSSRPDEHIKDISALVITVNS